MPVHQAETIEEAIERHIAEVGGKYGSDGAMVGCVRLSSIEQISNMVYALFSAFEKKEVDDKGREISSLFDPPPHVLFVIDLARALSDSPAKEPSFYGTIETLIGKKLASGKYKSVQVEWLNQPSVLIMSNNRPIQYKAGALSFGVPRCYLSAHRLLGNVFTIAKVGCQRELIQDTVCDELALKVREWETATQQTYVEEIQRVVPKTVRQLFMEHVMRDFTPTDPVLLPFGEWTSYNHLHALYQRVSPIKVAHSGPNNLKQLIAMWFKDHEAFLDEKDEPIRLKEWCKRLAEVGVASRNQLTKFSFKHTPGVGARAADERFRNGGDSGTPDHV